MSHLYYWVYPGCMVGVTAILSGYLLNQFFPDTFSSSYNSLLFMSLFCIIFALVVGYIAYRGVNGTTGVNMAINIIQIGALLVFSVIAIAYRVNHPQDSVGYHLSNGSAITYQVDQSPVLDDKNNPVQDTWADGSLKPEDKGNAVYKTQDRVVTKDDLASKDIPLPANIEEGDPYPVLKRTADGKVELVGGKAQAEPFLVSYKADEAVTGKDGDVKDPKTFNFHKTALSVIEPHGFNFIFIQACIAILILVGFESVTAMGEEARNAKRDVPRAVLLSLAIQGVVCYLIEYFAANYFLHNGYTIPNASASGAPVGDMMVLVGSWLFGSPAAGKAFMLVQAFTVFLALIGTTLSCLSTGARVTYAMGRDEEVSSRFGSLHGKTFSPHKAIWALTIVSAILGIITASVYLGGTSPSALDPKYNNVWYSFGLFSPDTYSKLPNSLVIITLISNFGTFLLYMTTCLVAIVAFREHKAFNGFKHFVVPLFGLIANLACMLFYLIGPFTVNGMSWKEPYIALAVAAIWAIIGLVYFWRRSKVLGRPILLEQKPSVG